MDILYLLIPMSALLVLGILGIFAWALHAGQFDEIEAEGGRILEPEPPLLDRDQRSPTAGNEQFARSD